MAVLRGAVVVADEGVDPTPSNPVVDEEAADVLAASRFSLGGVQLKFSMSGEPSRLTLGVHDDTERHWILKIGSPSYPKLAENEHAVMTWCRLAGFDVPETRVVPTESLPELGAIPDTPTAFLVERYDRVLGARIHQEDFAQVLNVRPTQKYNAINAAGLMELAALILGRAGAAEALRRLVVVVATGNADAHLKNWSLLYPNRITATWTPLYDQVATIAYPSLGRQLALRIGHAKAMNDVRMDHLLWVAAKAGLSGPEATAIVEETVTALQRAFREVDGMGDSLTAVLREHWSSVPLLARWGLD